MHHHLHLFVVVCFGLSADHRVYGPVLQRRSCIILVNKRVCVVMALYNTPKTTPRLTAVAAITFFLRETANFYHESD